MDSFYAWTYLIDTKYNSNIPYRYNVDGVVKYLFYSLRFSEERISCPAPLEIAGMSANTVRRKAIQSPPLERILPALPRSGEVLTSILAHTQSRISSPSGAVFLRS